MLEVMEADQTKITARRWTLNFVSGAFAIALALLFVLVLRSIAVQIAPPPEPLNEAYPDVSTQERCEEAGGRWVLQPAKVSPYEAAPVTSPVEEKQQPYCQGPLAFERERTAQDEHSRQISLFVFSLGGALAVAVSLLIAIVRPVAPGLMIGGIIAFVIAGIHIWTLAPGIGRLITIIVIFLILTGIGLYVFRDHRPTTTPPPNA